MRTNIVLDDQLVQEAFKYTRAKTKRELVENHRRRNLMDLFGQGGIRADYDYQQLRSGDA